METKKKHSEEVAELNQQIDFAFSTLPTLLQVLSILFYKYIEFNSRCIRSITCIREEIKTCFIYFIIITCRCLSLQ